MELDTIGGEALNQRCTPVGAINENKKITKKRAIELTNLSMQVYEKMKELGIEKHEYCHFGSVMQSLLQFPD